MHGISCAGRGVAVPLLLTLSALVLLGPAAAQSASNVTLNGTTYGESVCVPGPIGTCQGNRKPSRGARQHVGQRTCPLPRVPHPSFTIPRPSPRGTDFSDHDGQHDHFGVSCGWALPGYRLGV